MQRGSGGRVLFESDDGRAAYVESLKKVAGESGGSFGIYAWCLMPNHAHLPVHGDIVALPDGMRRVATPYAMRFNRKCGRAGHLFQGRFWSEPVDDGAYLAQVVRYIHSNPLKVGFRACGDCRRGGYREYLGEGGQGLSGTGFVLDALGGNEGFVLLHAADAGCALEEPWNAGRCALAADDEAVAAAGEALGAVSPCDLRSLDRAGRHHALLKLREAGLSFRQISRIAGISKSTVEYSLKRRNEKEIELDTGTVPLS